MQQIEAPTYTVQIFIAGDVRDAQRICSKFCMDNGFCVTVTPTTYVYTGGVEAGVIIGCINYPRFPTGPTILWDKAFKLANLLREGLYQHSYSMVAPDRTLWVTEREE